jgi:hypothetical protein
MTTELENIDRLLRLSVPEPFTSAAYCVGAAQGYIAVLEAAVTVLRMGLYGFVDSQDADDIAHALMAGASINWDDYAEATRNELKGVV